MSTPAALGHCTFAVHTPLRTGLGAATTLRPSHSHTSLAYAPAPPTCSAPLPSCSFAPLTSSPILRGQALCIGLGGPQGTLWGWELPEQNRGKGRGECTVSAARKKREPYVEPTFVFDMPAVSSPPGGPATSRPTQPPPRQQQAGDSQQQGAKPRQPGAEGKAKDRLAESSGAEPRYTGSLPPGPGSQPAALDLEGINSFSNDGTDADGSPPFRAPSSAPRTPPAPSSSLSARSPSRPSPAFQEAAAAPANPAPAFVPPPPGGMQVAPNHKSGYVALIGQPNAGKSTLLNALIGQKLSIVTRKPQTTRHRILGLCSAADYQIVLYDTPGVIPVVAHKLDDLMMHSVRTATINADCLVLVIDATLQVQKLEAFFQAGDSALGAVRKKPCLVVLNKKDAIKPGELAKKVEWYTQEAKRCLRRSFARKGGAASEDGEESEEEEEEEEVEEGPRAGEGQREREGQGGLEEEGEEEEGEEEGQEGEGEGEGEERVRVVALSAKHGHGVDKLLEWMLSSIPYGPAYYPKDVVSELPERFFVAEIMREQLLLQYHQEVPYACQVAVRTFQERKVGKDYIAFDIFVERESQKGILLGKGGTALKSLATRARAAIEEFLGREAFLEIVVKVKENWREDPQLLKQFGLSSQARGDWY